MSKKLRATSVLLLCFVSAVLLSGCAGMLSSNPGNPPPTAGDSGGNGGGSGSNNTPETLYESFTDFTTIPRTQGLRAFKVDSGNGTLSQLPGFPVSGPVEIQRADPTGKLIFSVHVDFSGPNSTTAYQINPSTAALTHSADNPGIGGALFFHPNNKFVYVLDPIHNTLSGFAYDSSGHFSPLPGSPYSTAGATFESMDLSPNGRFLYAEDDSKNSVVGYSVDPASGALTVLPGMPMQVRTVTQCDNCFRKDPSGIVVKFSADSQNLFIDDAFNGLLSSYSVNQSSGAITKVVMVTDREANQHIVVTPNARFLYEIGSGSACCEIRGFVIGPGGTLAAMPAGFAVPVGPETFINTALILDPAGRFLYQANNSGTFSGFVIDQNTGNLTPNGQIIKDNVAEGVVIVR